MFRSALFLNTIQTKQPATCRCLEEGDVFRVNAASWYEQRNHILTLDTLIKGTQRISLFVQIPVETSLLIISTFFTLYENKIFNEIFYMIVLWYKKTLSVQPVRCYNIFQYRTLCQVRMVRNIHC